MLTHRDCDSLTCNRLAFVFHLSQLLTYERHTDRPLHL